jgi:hypothetical protein
MTFLRLDFLRCDKFRFAFFAFVEVHHVTIKEQVNLIKTFFLSKHHSRHDFTGSFQSTLNTDIPYIPAGYDDSMTKKNHNQTDNHPKSNQEDRETKILNLLCNTSLVLMTMLTEAVSQVFTSITKEMVTALSTGMGSSQDVSANLNDLEKNIPEKLRAELMTMKNDLKKQFNEKKHELSGLLSDPRFDEGITIAERASVSLPKLTLDLDERALFGYLALLQAEDPAVSSMFKDLFEWMNTLPKFEKKEE